MVGGVGMLGMVVGVGMLAVSPKPERVGHHFSSTASLDFPMYDVSVLLKLPLVFLVALRMAGMLAVRLRKH